MLTEQDKRQMYERWYKISMEAARESGHTEEAARSLSEDYADVRLCEEEKLDREFRALTRGEIARAREEILRVIRNNETYGYRPYSFYSRRVSRLLAAIPERKIRAILKNLVKEGTLISKPGWNPTPWTPAEAEMGKKWLDVHFEALQHWSGCLHEAGHAVQGTRDGQSLISAWVAERVTDRKQPAGEVRWRTWSSMRALTAGHLAQKRWGYGLWVPVENPKSGAGHDLRIIRRLHLEASREAAGEGAVLPPSQLRWMALLSWHELEKELSDLWAADLSYGRQILAVARQLSLRERLTGDEVCAAMAAA